MIKLVYCITKKPGMSDAEFSRYWKDVHGPIGRRIPGLKKLVQSHTIPNTGGIHRSDFDGMAELWFEDMEALLAARQSAEWKASSEDEENFIDHNKVAFFITEEHEIQESDNN